MSTTTAQWIYLATLIWPLLCLTYLHMKGRVDLLTTITTTKDSKTYVDPKKLAYMGIFFVMATGFAYLAMLDKLSEWYAGICVAAFVGGKWLGDREQRLQKALEVPKVELPKPAAQP